MRSEREECMHGQTHCRNKGTDWQQMFDENAPLARAYVPWQRLEELFPPEAGLCKGTIFPALHCPYGGRTDDWQRGGLL